MNDQTTPGDLPELSDETIARIEESVFAEIATERAPATAPPAEAKSHTRRRRWLTGGGIAAAFVIGVLVTPPILGAVGGSSSVTAEGLNTQGGSVADSAPSSPERITGVTPESLPDGALSSDVSGEMLPGTAVSDSGREIIATAQATVQVTNIPDASAAIAALAEEHGGYVESTEIGKTVAVDGTSEPVPGDSAYGWIGIRVPSADLAEVIAALVDTGEVLSSSTSKQDVTSVAIDLQARVDSTKASVERLTQLMAQSGSVSELIEAEVALTDRQAQLESYEQQLAALDDQVAMSSLQVQLTKASTPTTADPAGFGDGLLAGWNGLVVSLNALVIAIGFILPWLAIAGAAVLIIWVIRRTRRNRRIARASSAEKSPDES